MKGGDKGIQTKIYNKIDKIKQIMMIKKGNNFQDRHLNFVLQIYILMKALSTVYALKTITAFKENLSWPHLNYKIHSFLFIEG